jgi:phosphoglycerate kinase
MLAMTDADLAQKRVMIREDLNVPMKDGKITNDERIQRALPTIKSALEKNAAVMLLSHLGRPTEGEYDEAFSLAPVAAELSKQLGFEVKLIKDWLDGVDVAPGEVVLLENVRFNPGEKKNNTELAKKMAALCDVFVMDAFATAHRAQASTAGIAEHAQETYAGPLLMTEIDALTKAMDNPKRPLVAIVGGSKVSTKIQLLEALLDKVDVLIVGGGIANTLLAAQGYPIGKSLYEADWLEKSKDLLAKAKQKGVDIPLPLDVAVAKEFDSNAKCQICELDQVADDDLILDVGPKTIAAYMPLMEQAGTVVWNGPVGVFEFPAFAQGTRGLGEAIVNSKAYSLAGGGDTVAAIQQFGFHDKISYISTGGGAFLEFLQGDVLPAVAVLEKRETDINA